MFNIAKMTSQKFRFIVLPPPPLQTKDILLFIFILWKTSLSCILGKSFAPAQQADNLMLCWNTKYFDQDIRSYLNYKKCGGWEEFHICLFVVFIPKAPVPDLGRTPGEVQGLCILPSPLSKQGQNSLQEPLKDLGGKYSFNKELKMIITDFNVRPREFVIRICKR